MTRTASASALSAERWGVTASVPTVPTAAAAWRKSRREGEAGLVIAVPPSGEGGLPYTGGFGRSQEKMKVRTREGTAAVSSAGASEEGESPQRAALPADVEDRPSVPGQ